MKKQLHEMTNEELWELFPIILREHNPQYKEWYEVEKQNTLGYIETGDVARINHIGSSAVEGLIAKQTIDILLEMKIDCNVELLKENLEMAGWGCIKSVNSSIPMTFIKGYTVDGFADKVFHLHIKYLGDWDELYFRDYLIQYNAIAKEYSNMKLRLQKEFEHDRDKYTDEKSEFVKKYSALAKEEYKGRYKP